MALFIAFKQIMEIESNSIYEAFKAEFDKLMVGSLSLPINIPGTNYYRGFMVHYWRRYLILLPILVHDCRTVNLANWAPAKTRAWANWKIPKPRPSPRPWDVLAMAQASGRFLNLKLEISINNSFNFLYNLLLLYFFFFCSGRFWGSPDRCIWVCLFVCFCVCVASGFNP